MHSEDRARDIEVGMLVTFDKPRGGSLTLFSDITPPLLEGHFMKKNDLGIILAKYLSPSHCVWAYVFTTAGSGWTPAYHLTRLTENA